MDQREITAYVVAHQRDHILRWIESQGADLTAAPADTARLRELVQEVLQALPDLLPELAGRGLVDVHVYERDRQTREDLRASDGMTWVDVTGHTGTLYAIGIAADALGANRDYQVLVFLHEAAHVLQGEHSWGFHVLLDGLIQRYNDATGSHIINDYDGLPV
ncbi:MAG: hypothetical protein IKB65_09450 [Ruminiclostridium sp.]|nr:hypothetical protein [Ruminiclostridium sp.]